MESSATILILVSMMIKFLLNITPSPPPYPIKIVHDNLKSVFLVANFDILMIILMRTTYALTLKYLISLIKQSSGNIFDKKISRSSGQMCQLVN